MRSVVLSVDCGGDVAARSCSTASSTGAAATAVRPSLNRSRRRTTLALRAGVDSRGAAALSECSVVSFIVSSPTLEQPLDRRHLPTAGLLLDVRHRREHHVVAPWLRHELDAERQARRLGRRTHPHHAGRPAGRVVLARVGRAAAVALRLRTLVVERNRRSLARGRDDQVVLLEPGELLALDRVHLLAEAREVGARYDVAVEP